MSELNQEQMEILRHTAKARNSAYCGKFDDPDLVGLVDQGYLSGPRHSGFLPVDEAYFQITSKGFELVKTLEGGE